MATLPKLPPSPGVGARRKGPKSKALPTLPLSAFSPPNTGVSDNFPLPPSPSTVHPDSVIDASVRGSILEWKKQTAGFLDGRVSSVVVKTSGDLEGYASVVWRASIPSSLIVAQARIAGIRSWCHRSGRFDTFRLGEWDNSYYPFDQASCRLHDLIHQFLRRRSCYSPGSAEGWSCHRHRCSRFRRGRLGETGRSPDQGHCTGTQQRGIHRPL